jgi:putative transposase
MPRHARFVFPGIPHHVTQRGNRREEIFFDDTDRRAYLDWLAEYCVKHRVSLLAYCLMRNHVHIVAVPESGDGLERVFRPLHTRYAQRINRAKNWRGHVLQGRYFSSALDGAYFWAAIRYVERNPVRAQIVGRAEDYRWSSAASHCGLSVDPVLAAAGEWVRRLNSIADWSTWLAEGDKPAELDALRRHVDANLPCGSEEFVRNLQDGARVTLLLRPPGRPRKEKAACQ